MPEFHPHGRVSERVVDTWWWGRALGWRREPAQAPAPGAEREQEAADRRGRFRRYGRPRRRAGLLGLRCRQRPGGLGAAAARGRPDRPLARHLAGPEPGAEP